MQTIQTLKQQTKDLSREIFLIGCRIAEDQSLSFELDLQRQKLVSMRKALCQALEEQTGRDWYEHLRESVTP